ncbi:hypothetical protein DMN91_011305 [Ooceraea biroi]|uniref:Uncharacterized protein n=1 Tax=Ooceraea biroi TaxID=2015173 RepID=A0A026WSJ3_OOCBI|nr:uncharacterized serine-rich protein C215.13 [Ooceraea biroi]XP_026829556.1 uncharacterized serine-rich protein C215.13 [Ooceraea biroi]EZA59002.1 hypothetical protein X777_16962 [Ooceraea biroi]RLU17236.1 hypothetical protein DMN91_011305 [Ooceraea biroi]
MSPRRTRTATTMDQSPEQRTTRSKAQKLNNTNRDAIKSVEKKSQQSQRKKKSSNVKSDSEGKQSPKSSKAKKKKFTESVKKKGSHRKLILTEEVEDMGKFLLHGNLSTSSNELRVKTESEGKVRNKSNTSVQVKELTKDGGSPLNSSRDLKRNKTPSKRLKWKVVLTGVNISPSMVTPKSTPPKLSLTPHRSKKTPKKSPISLGSPKTHTKAVPRLFKSPRKLSLSSISGLENTDKPSSGKTRKKTSSKSKKNSSGELSPSDKDSSVSPVEKSKRKKSSLNPKPTVRRFSNQSKRALKPQKTKKSSSPSKLRLSSPHVDKDASKMSSPNTTRSLDDARSSRTSTPSARNRTLLAIKRRLNPKLRLPQMTASQIKHVLAGPVVLVEKLPSENIRSTSTISRTTSNTSIKVKSPLTERRNSSKKLTPIITKSPGKLNVFADRNSGSKLKPSRAGGSTDRLSPRNKENTLTQKKERSSIPLMSSTPREEKIPLMDMNLTSATPILSLTNVSFNTRSSRSNTRLSDIMDKSTIIANISRPSLMGRSVNGASRSYLSNDTIQQTAYETATPLKEDKNKKDNTYELEQSRTVNLQRMIRKRSSTDANLTPKMDNKKTKVCFVNGTSDTNSAGKSIKWTASRSSVSQNNTRSSITSSAHKLRQMEIPKFRRSPLVSALKRKSSLLKSESTPTTRLNMTQNTPKTFGSVLKKSEKKSSVKKKPDFAKIHERMFARSESLVDAKKRLESRHMAVFGNKAAPKADESKKEEKKPLPSDTNDGTHNRFGFKLRKTEAVKIMSKKQPSLSRQKQQQKARMVLKGVRTNRRFELQMKSRNLNV